MDEVRLIDANALKKNLNAVLKPGICPEVELSTLAVVEMEMERVPTVDAVPVVRCRDCQAATSEHPEITNFVLDCEVWKKCVLPDWYCCHGRRKEAEDHA